MLLVEIINVNDLSVPPLFSPLLYMLLAEIINVNDPIIPTNWISVLSPVTDPVLAEAVAPSLVDGRCAPPAVGVEVGGRAIEVAGDLALGVGSLTTTGVGDEGDAAGKLEAKITNKKTN